MRAVQPTNHLFYPLPLSPHICRDMWEVIVDHLEWEEKYTLFKTNKFFFNFLFQEVQDLALRCGFRFGSIVRNRYKVKKFEKSWSEILTHAFHILFNATIVCSRTKVCSFEEYSRPKSCRWIRVINLNGSSTEFIQAEDSDSTISGFNLDDDELFYTTYSYNTGLSHLFKQNVKNNDKQEIILPYSITAVLTAISKYKTSHSPTRIHIINSYCVIRSVDHIYIHDRNDLTLLKQISGSDAHYCSWVRQILLKRLPTHLHEEPEIRQSDVYLERCSDSAAAWGETIFSPNYLGGFEILNTALDLSMDLNPKNDISRVNKIRVFASAVIVVKEQSIDLWNLFQRKLWGSMTFTSKILDLAIYDNSSFVIAFQNGTIARYSAT